MKRTRRLTKIATIVACIAILAFLIIGAVFHWAWAGFDKPLYDWMQLLIIPVVLALVAVWFNRTDKKNEQAIASDNQRESALQSYFDRMSELVLKENLDTSQPTDKVRTIARVRTLTVLPSLNAVRRSSIVQFLFESHLIKIIDLSGANFQEVSFNGTYLAKARLAKANLSKANFIEANFIGADLYEANLSGADLSGADLAKANLSKANLSKANLSKANLYRTDLSKANLSGADFTKAHFYEADLSGADFTKANLSGATVDKSNFDKFPATKEQIATMEIVYI